MLARRLRLFAAFIVLAGVAACHPERVGMVKAVVIGAEPRLADPAAGPMSGSDAMLVGNVAQGLVRFDSAGQIEPGLAERWNVSDDGLSYIFRLAEVTWPDGRKVTAVQVARALKRSLGSASRDVIKDTFGAIDDIVPMTDRVVEIRLKAPRPNLLQLLAQPELGVVRDGGGTGPFRILPKRGPAGELDLRRDVLAPDGDEGRRDELLLGSADAASAVREFAAGKTDVVIGGTVTDLPVALAAKIPRDALRFDPASGLFGLVGTRHDGPLARPEVRQLLTQSIDRDALVQALAVPGLAARATVLEPGLDGVPDPTPPAWQATALADRRAALQAEARRLFPGATRPLLRIALPAGPGGDIILLQLARDWGAIGIDVARAPTPLAAELRLIDEVAPSTSPAWFLRHFRCDAAALCDPAADVLLDAARAAPVAPQRAALLAQASLLVDAANLFIPLSAPVRWSLVSRRIEGFNGNRFARHTLTDLDQKPDSEGGE